MRKMNDDFEMNECLAIPGTQSLGMSQNAVAGVAEASDFNGEGLVSRLLGSRRFKILAGAVGGMLLLMALDLLLPEWRIFEGLSTRLSAFQVFVLIGTALFCEYIDSSLGMGYGTTLTPLLLLAGVEPLKVVPCILLSELLTGLFSSFMHHRDGNVNFLKDPLARSTTLLLSVLSAAGAAAAVFFAVRLSRFWLTVFIGVIVVGAGIVTLVSTRRQFRYRRGHILGLGALAAFNKGLSGGGYGPLVTAGQVVSGVPARSAVAITSMAESYTCLVGLIAYLVAGKSIDWTLAVPLSLGAMLSVPMATLTVKSLSERSMKLGVGIVTCVLGVVTLSRLFG